MMQPEAPPDIQSIGLYTLAQRNFCSGFLVRGHVTACEGVENNAFYGGVGFVIRGLA